MTEQNSNLLIEGTILAPQTGLETVRGPRSATTLDLRAEQHVDFAAADGPWTFSAPPFSFDSRTVKYKMLVPPVKGA